MGGGPFFVFDEHRRPWQPMSMENEGKSKDCAETCLAAQKFFSDLALETHRPHYGDKDREIVKNLLLRAQEAKLYNPEVI